MLLPMLQVRDTRRPQPHALIVLNLLKKHTDHFNGHFPGDPELAGLHIDFSSSWTVQISVLKRCVIVPSEVFCHAQLCKIS